jgi:hypothetical protein
MLAAKKVKNSSRLVGTQCDYNLNRLKSLHIPSLTGQIQSGQPSKNKTNRIIELVNDDRQKKQ